MDTLELIRTQFDYNYALYRRLWDSINTLSDEQFVEDVDYSHGSIHNQMIHVTMVDKRWLMGLQEDPDGRAFSLSPSDYPTRGSVRALWDGVSKEVIDYVAGLDEAGLTRTAQGMSGPVWQVLIHMVNHGTDHRAQILRALHDFGAPTFDQDLILHLWVR